jgi:tetratricopeptide (TPR) repeat protein
MIGFIIRVVLTATALWFNFYLFYTGYWGWGITFIFVSALLVLSFFRNENVIIALYQMRLGRQDKAWKALSRIRDPRFLPRKQHAYVLYLQGMLGLQNNLGFAKCEQMIRKALQLGLRTKQDQAVAKMQLAGICMQSGRKQEAQTFISEAKKLDTNGLLKEQLDMMKKQMTMVASKNQMRMAQMHRGRKKMPRGNKL